MSPNDEVYAFNPNNRMYTHFIHKPYDESSQDNYLDESVLTWNFWWETNWVLGHELLILYTIADRFKSCFSIYTFGSSSK